jgi:hypothetical protein
LQYFDFTRAQDLAVASHSFDTLVRLYTGMLVGAVAGSQLGWRAKSATGEA